ncbi:hypothetical protein [Clostridium perfringens]|uniref:hypothetical protein n=1 Tax=Clostridium perfringens TaxID=1502 RepID=UPI00375480BF
MITQKGYEELVKIDSIRTLRVFLKLAQLSNFEGNTSVTQSVIAKELNLKNKSNVNISIAELFQKDFLRKKIEGKKITYYLNPDYFVTPKGYKVLQEDYENLNFDISLALKNLNWEEI